MTDKPFLPKKALPKKKGIEDYFYSLMGAILLVLSLYYVLGGRL